MLELAKRRLAKLVPEDDTLWKSSSRAGGSDSKVIGIADTPIRPHIVGKFIHIGLDKFYVKGVSYGAFRPDTNKEEYWSDSPPNNIAVI